MADRALAVEHRIYVAFELITTNIFRVTADKLLRINA